MGDNKVTMTFSNFMKTAYIEIIELWFWIFRTRLGWVNALGPFVESERDVHCPPMMALLAVPSPLECRPPKCWRRRLSH